VVAAGSRRARPPSTGRSLADAEAGRQRPPARDNATDTGPLARYALADSPHGNQVIDKLRFA